MMLPKILRGVLLALFCMACGFVSSSSDPASDLTDEPLVVFLVRHAEKADSSRDPDLKPAGIERAEALAQTLRSAEIDQAHSTDFIRTRKTAAPVARGLGIEVEIYDHRNLPALVEKMHEFGGRHLVVGHSNTTPVVVELLGGRPGKPIEDTEYDRLYIVTIGADGQVSTVVLRFGEPYSDE